MRLGNIARTANDALHAGALELARLGAVGDLLRCVIGAQPLVGEVPDGCVVLGTQARHGCEQFVLHTHAGGEATGLCTGQLFGACGARLQVGQYDLRKFAVNALHEGFGGHLRQSAHIVLHHSLLGDDVVLQAAGCQVHATGGVGNDERLVERAFFFPLVRHVGEEGDELACCGNRVHAMGGEGAVLGHAGEGDAAAVCALVRVDNAHAGGLTNNRVVGGEVARHELLDKGGCTNATDFLIVGEREVQGSAQLRFSHARQQPERDGEEPLHIADTAAVGAGTLHTQGEGVGVPRLTGDGYDVRVAGEDNAAAGGAVSGRDGDQQVGAGAVLVVGAHAAVAVAGKFGFDELNKFQVGGSGDSGERDELFEPGEGCGLGGLSRHNYSFCNVMLCAFMFRVRRGAVFVASLSSNTAP